jgi:DNA-binding NtrC family response regulator
MKHKILIVDDEENILFVVKAAFISKYDVFTATGGEAALEIIKRESPSFIFLDIKMPGLSGVQVLELIKETGVKPVIWMLTGDEDLDMALATLQGGASGYITKPFDIERLRGVVLAALEDLEKGEKGRKAKDKPWHIGKEESDK